MFWLQHNTYLQHKEKCALKYFAEERNQWIIYVTVLYCTRKENITISLLNFWSIHDKIMYVHLMYLLYLLISCMKIDHCLTIVFLEGRKSERVDQDLNHWHFAPSTAIHLLDVPRQMNSPLFASASHL